VHPGFITATGITRLPDVERYLRAASRRLERLPNAPAPDLDRMRGIQELEREYEARIESWPSGRPLPAALRDVPWLLEELRVSHFAQALGTRGQVSAKRIRKVIQEP
jgi:ATP-dependent helicase HrpA